MADLLPGVRPPRADELERLREIESAAGVLFRQVGLDDVADGPLPPVEVLDEFRRAGRAWVAVDHRDRPVGYAVAMEVDGGGHLQQVSVVPEWGRRGLGRRLVEQVCRWAAAEGYGWVTLSTFRDVPWNGPYYERLGFAALADDELGPGLLRLREHERSAGLDVTQRHFMRRACP